MRPHLAIIFLILFLGSYSMILWEAFTSFIPNDGLMRAFLLKIDGYKWLTFGCYFLSNSIMCMTAKSNIEKDILATGIFCIGITTLVTVIHKLSILVMSTQLSLILINGLTICILLIVLVEGRKNGEFR